MCARCEGVRVMVEQDYKNNKEFVLAEMKEITKLNYEMIEQIKNKIGNLEENVQYN